MNTKYYIAPCSVKMTDEDKTETGYFCGLCKKDVVDFSKMEIDEIQQYFKIKQSGEVCGVLNKKEIKGIRYLNPHLPTGYWAKMKTVVLSIISFMVIKYAFLTEVYAQTTGFDQSIHLSPLVKNKVKKTKKQVTGIVRDRNNQIVPSVLVTLYNEKGQELTHTRSLINGDFTLPIPDDISLEQKFTIATSKETFSNNTLHHTAQVTYTSVKKGITIKDFQNVTLWITKNVILNDSRLIGKISW